MITVRLTTWVNAPVERCFLLAMSRELMPGGSEGHRGRGTLEPSDRLSWELGIGRAKLSYVSRIDGVRPCTFFRETMVTGVFRQFEHEHHFAAMDDGTRIRDEIRFDLRYGPLGRLLGPTVVRASLKKMLEARGRELKRIAESGEWRRYLEPGQRMPAEGKDTAPVRGVQQFAQG